MDEQVREKLIFVRDNVFGPNSSVYECMTDEELFENYEDFGESKHWKHDGDPWWQDHYKTKNKLIAWGRFQLETESEFWSREGIDAKDFLKDITKRWNHFLKLEKKYNNNS